MNCMDFFHIVDTCDVNRLSATERSDCEAHAAACRHCAPHWVAFAALAAIPVPAMPREVAMRCETLAAIESRGAGRRMAAGRVVVIGAIAALAAGATLVWRMSGGPAPVEPAVALAETGPVATEPVIEVVQDVPASVPPDPETSQPAAPVEASPGFTVLVMTPRHEAPDVSRRGAVEALHAALLDELRKVPALTLKVPGESVPEAGLVNHVLTLSSLATTVAPAGGIMLLGTDGTSRCVDSGNSGMPCSPVRPQRQDTALSITNVRSLRSGDGTVDEFISFPGHSLVSDDLVWIELKVEPGSPAGIARYTFPTSAGGAPDSQRCPISDGNPYCMTPAKLAAQYVNTLRLQVSPPDAGYLQQLLAQLGNPGQAPARGVTLDDLLKALTRGDGSGLDAGTIRALVNYLASQRSETRANAWSWLRQVSHPGLVEPLIESLRHDPDQKVRLAALACLLDKYSANPDVRRALEEIDREGTDPTVRATVRRAIYGPEQWRTDLLIALNDTGLSYEDRLSPLLAASSGAAQSDAETLRMRKTVLQEQQVFGPLITLIREYLHDAGHATATGGALGTLAGVDDPDVFAFFLELARDSSSLPSEVFRPVGIWAINHAKDPRVAEILPRIEAVQPFGTMLRGMREITEQRISAGDGPAASGSGPVGQAPTAQ